MHSNEDSGSEHGTKKIKKHEIQRMGPVTSIVQHKRPFKLRFTQKQDVGRSYVSLVKPFGLGATVTCKFYTKQQSDDVTDEHVDEVYKRIQKMFIDGPREKLKNPLMDSQNYGWYYNVKFTNNKRTDRRFYHGIQDSHMVKSQILILSTAKKTGHKK